MKKVIRATKSGLEYTNGNCVIIFTSFNQKPPKKIYIDSHRITLVYSTITALYISTEENTEEQIENNNHIHNNETESISGESIHSRDLFAEKSDEAEETINKVEQEIEMDMEIRTIPETLIDNLVKAANSIDSLVQLSPVVTRKKARATPPELELSPAMIDSKIPRVLGHTHTSTQNQTRRSRNAENKAKKNITHTDNERRDGKPDNISQKRKVG